MWKSSRPTGSGLSIYNSIINYFAKNKNFAKASELYKDMVQLQVKPDVRTYTILLWIECAQGFRQNVEKLVQEMKEKKIEVSVQTIDSKLNRTVLAGCNID